MFFILCQYYFILKNTCFHYIKMFSDIKFYLKRKKRENAFALSLRELTVCFDFFQFFINYFFRIFVIFGFHVKINNLSGFRNLCDYLAFFVVISCLPGISSSSKKSHRISVHLLFLPVLSFRSFLISLTIP